MSLFSLTVRVVTPGVARALIIHQRCCSSVKIAQRNADAPSASCRFSASSSRRYNTSIRLSSMSFTSHGRAKRRHAGWLFFLGGSAKPATSLDTMSLIATVSFSKKSVFMRVFLQSRCESYILFLDEKNGSSMSGSDPAMPTDRYADYPPAPPPCTDSIAPAR